MKLGPVIRKTKASNRYCGPAVISALTGADTAETARVLRYVTGKTSIKGTHWKHVLDALELYGIVAEKNEKTGLRYTYAFRDGKRPTLTQWLREVDRPAGKVYLVSAGYHWQLVSGRRYVCGITGDVVSVKDKKVKRRARVEAHTVLTATRRIGLDEATRAAFAREDERAKARARARGPSIATWNARLNRIGIEVEREHSDLWWVGPMDNRECWRDELDPFEGDHYVHRDEVKDRAEEYLRVWQSRQ